MYSENICVKEVENMLELSPFLVKLISVHDKRLKKRLHESVHSVGVQISEAFRINI